MSYSRAPRALPELAINSDTWNTGHSEVMKRQNAARIVLAITGLMKLIIDTLDGLRSSTDLSRLGVRSLWIEVIQNARAFMHTWIAQVRRLALASEKTYAGLIRPDTDKKSMPLGRVDFIESYNKLTYALVLRHFKSISKVFIGSLHDILKRLNMPGSLKSNARPTWTGRPFPEILVEAILRSTYKKSGSKAVWLHQLPLNCGASEIFQAEKMQRRVGTVACVSAMWSGQNLYTGSTLVSWSKALEKLCVRTNITEMRSIGSWYKHTIRQSRFNGKEQKLLDKLLGLQVGYFKQRLTHYMAVPRRMSAEQARSKAIKDTPDTAVSRLPPRLVRYFQRNPGGSVCLAYEGQGTFLPKDKCLICDCCFIVPDAYRDKGSPNWDDAGECRTIGPHGVCAEALAFVLVVLDIFGSKYL